MHQVLWSFVEAGVKDTQAEARVRRVAGDGSGRPKLANKIWAHAIGEAVNENAFDWMMHCAPEAAGPWTGAKKPGAQDLAALRAFGSGQTVQGPFSQTAAAQMAPPEVGWVAAPGPVGGGGGASGLRAPFAPGDAVKLGMEANVLRATLTELQSRSTTDVCWTWHFWERIHAVDCSQGLHPDLRRQLQCHGYVGAGTKSPPGPSLPRELESLLACPASSHGSGLAGGPQWSWAPPIAARQEDSRWNLSLLPDPKRAAPEIYRAMRGARAAGARGWLSQEVRGQRRAAVWTDLWSVMRAKDKVGAAAMLAVRPPGSSADLAPTWLVTEATARGEAERQRGERVAASGKRDGRGAGRGGGFSGSVDQAAGGRGRGGDGGG
ncbi:unnamed protein product, partial [Prorocentrum cordatum]